MREIVIIAFFVMACMWGAVTLVAGRRWLSPLALAVFCMFAATWIWAHP